MKTQNQMTLMCLIFIGLTISSCKEIINGCTNPKASNYNAKATDDDGSCKFTPLCETNKTGEVYFINNSNSNKTYDIIWDGSKIATVAPNQSSQTFTFSANVQHTLEFRFTNTSNNACTPSTPFLNQCQRRGFNCTG